MDDKKDKSVINKDVFKNRHVIRHDFIGETLSAEDFAEFQKIVDVRRPYTARDLGNPKFNLHNMGREYGD